MATEIPAVVKLMIKKSTLQELKNMAKNDFGTYTKIAQYAAKLELKKRKR